MDIESNNLQSQLIANSNFIKYEELPFYLTKKKEAGELASWNLSSAKQGNGIIQLRDNNVETFWQSDGPIPHLINIQFLKKTAISEIAIYLDYKTDESYTPKELSVRGGIHMNNLKEIVRVTLNDPTNWFVIPLRPQDSSNKVSANFVYTLNLQIAVLQMHHSGKDTHIRQVKVFTAAEADPHHQTTKKGNRFNDSWQYFR